MFIFRHWPAGLLVFYWCLISPAIFACEAILQLSMVSGFIEKGSLGSRETYVQRVYSGDNISYSSLVFPLNTPFNKKSLIQQTAKSMFSTVSAINKGSKPQLQILNDEVLPKLDVRLAFLSYITYEASGLINVEASASIKNGSCWSILRFSGLKKQTKDEALNHFANLIKATQLAP